MVQLSGSWFWNIWYQSCEVVRLQETDNLQLDGVPFRTRDGMCLSLLSLKDMLFSPPQGYSSYREEKQPS